MKEKCMQMKERWKDMNAHWNEHESTVIWKENEGTWIHMRHERRAKGKWHEINAKWKEYACKWMQKEGGMKCCWSTWNQQNNSSIYIRACLGLDFGFMLDLEYADVHKTLESDRAPSNSDNHNNSNYAHVQDFDGSSHIDIIDIICRLCLCNHRLGLLIQLFRLCFSIANCLIAGG